MTSGLVLKWGVELLTLTVLVSIVVQDWRWRGVYWYCFPALALLLMGSRLLRQPTDAATLAADAGVNILFVVVQLMILGLYIRLRFGVSPLSLHAYLGLGDILYWLTAAIFFPPVLYLLYLISSMLVALVVFMGVRRYLPAGSDKRVPLAGLQAGFLAFLLVASWGNHTALLTDPAWVLAYFPGL